MVTCIYVPLLTPDSQATVKEAEDLFRTKYHLFEHEKSSTMHVACDEYSVPARISSHIDFVSPGVHFDSKTKSDTDQYYAPDGTPLMSKRSAVETKRKRSSMGKSHSPHLPKPALPHWGSYEDQVCNTTFVTPACLRLLYGLPTNVPAVAGNSLGIVEYTPESYLPSDLDLFFKNYEPKAVGERPDVILYQVGDLAEEDYTSFNNFLDAIDASYCTYDGGDDPTYDAVYPDPYPGPHSYQGKENCGTYAAAKVISTSYAYAEIELSPAYEERQCNEYMKLGLMGTTFVYSSGDYGVEFDGGGCLNQAETEINNGNSGIFVPTFPGTCPYVLTAGATQIKNGTYNVDSAIAAGEEVEVVMELYLTADGLVGDDVPPGADVLDQVIFSSSGGFSNVFPLPAYQKSAVTEYMEKYAPKYPGQYNNSGTVRESRLGVARHVTKEAYACVKLGFPDISSNGAWLSIAVYGELSQVFGTSCAAPTIAAILALLNGERMKVGKSSVGFVNPTLYAHPEVLNDITEGQNPGCGTDGFSAVPGWDPTTGLGTPNYPKMLALFLSLP
ncbi:Aorsin [Lachnellula suecica]|uniref:Aorsin n=1 Tax=Lachnellula suecica TaxID=602035 RepID=A0A8T9CGJ0_9HELO|nr:Aorsin [Lachnellula suecica]